MAHEHEKHLDLSIQLNRCILKSIGVWPAANQVSLSQKCLRRFLNVLCYCLISVIFVPCGLYMIYEVKDTYSNIKLTGPMSFCVMATIKYYELIFRSADIRKCIEYMETDWRTVRHPRDRDIMLLNASFGRRLGLVCVFFTYGGMAFYYIALPISVGRVTMIDDNVTFIPLLYPVSSLIVDARYSPVNEIFFSLQFVYGFAAHTIAAATCSLAAVLAMHACGQLEALMQWLEHLVDGREDLHEEFSGRLADVVRKHVKVLRFLTLTEKVLQHISLIDIVGCTFTMSLLGYYIIKEWDPTDPTSSVTYVILLLSFTFNIFIFCYIGEIVAEKCQKVGAASYMIEWYRLPGRQSLSLILMILMSTSSIKLTAGNLFELSMSSFGAVVKTSVAYLNMLRKMTT